MKRLIWTFVLCLAAGSLGAQDLVILHTNDTHSHMEGHKDGRDQGRGGILARAAYVDQVRKEGKPLLYLDAGDFDQGTPYYPMFGGSMEVEVLNALGVDATIFGNHEFDDGVEDLAERLAQARFKILCANFNIKYAPLAKYVQPYAIFKRGGRKIGVIGLTTELDNLASAQVVAQMEFLGYAAPAQKYADLLRAKGCDLVICLTHIGVEEDVPLAKATSGIDYIIGGHSHTFLDKPIEVKNAAGKPVYVTQAGAEGVYVGRLEVTF